ncbi:YceD family protein [Myxococcota bacterium]|nr:YceD family protein [Myxococcota bacterium]
MAKFKLLIDRLTDRPQRFDYEVEPDWWTHRAGEEERPGEGEIDRPFRFEIAAHRLGEDVLIEGALDGGLRAECSRCTRRYAHALRDTFRLVLEPYKEDLRGAARAHEAIDPEGVRAIAENGICLGDDLEAGWFRGPVIFLDDFFAEVVATAMPIQPLCDEDCPGLCPHCGMERGMERGVERAADRDVARCSCSDERVESPFAVLANWKGKSESESSAEKNAGKARSRTASGSGSRKRS